MPALGCRMSFRPFTSESYARDDRPEAWRDVLGAVGLQPASGSSFYDGHATASHRSAAGVALSRISAGSQSVAPLPQPGEDMPIALLSMEDGVVLRSGAGHRIVPAGHLLLLPRCGDWSVVFQRDMRFGGEPVFARQALGGTAHLADAAVEAFDCLPLIGIDELADDGVTKIERAVDGQQSERVGGDEWLRWREH